MAGEWKPEDVSYMPRSVCGYCCVWQSPELIHGEYWKTTRKGAAVPDGPLPFLDTHISTKRFGTGVVTIDDVGVFFSGRFYRSWMAMEGYEALMKETGYCGFSVGSKRDGKWTRHGDKYIMAEFNKSVYEVSLHRDPVFKKTYAVLCHPHQVALVRSIQKMRLKHGLKHPPRSDWRNLGRLAAVTTMVVSKLVTSRPLHRAAELGV